MRSPFGCTSPGLAAAFVVALGATGCAAKNGAGAVLRIETPQADRDADVFIDGNYIGQVGEVMQPSAGPIRLAPGVHRLEVRKPGRFPVQRTLRVDKRTSSQLVVQAELLTDPQ